MSTRHSIWLGESEGKSVHVYWELAERDMEDGKWMKAPVYIAADTGDANKEVAVRLPREIAIQLLMILSANPAEDVARVV